MGRGYRARWTRPDQFHITLKFLGETPAEALEPVTAATREAVRGWEAFTVSFQGVGAFPNWARPRILWAHVAAGQEALSRLAGHVEEALADLGVTREKRPFRAHVTLGRIPEHVDAPAGPVDSLTLAAGPEHVDRVVVYESRLTPRGAVYTERHSLSLQGV